MNKNIRFIRNRISILFFYIYLIKEIVMVKKPFQKKKLINVLGNVSFIMGLGVLGINNIYAQTTVNTNVNTNKTSVAPTAQPNLTQSSQAQVAPVAAAAPVIKDYDGTTLDKIKQSGKVIIGNRKDVIPLSYINNGQPIGYSIDICLAVVDKIKEAVGNPNLKVEYVTVDGKTRIPYVREGRVDLECGSTTNNAARRKEVAFSIPYYISGVRILTATGTGIKTLNDLHGKRVALGAGTTSVDIITKANKQRALEAKPVIEKDSTSAFEAVVNKKADAFVLDDLLLFGARSSNPTPNNYPVVGEFLSVEPLAIMIRKNDPQFKELVDKTMLALINSGQINQYYKKWFESPIPPKNQTLDIPQSPLLKEVFRMPTDVVGN